MGKRIYNWKRFWVEREGGFNLSDGGYLTDPDTEWGRLYSRGAIALSTIARSPCLVLLGEPGIGKSTAIKSEFDALETQDSAKRLFLDLREVGSDWQLDRKLFSSSDFQSWKNASSSLRTRARYRIM